MKKFLCAVLTVIASASLFSTNVSAISFTPSFEIKSDAVYLLNLESGDVIYEKNSDKAEMPSSLVNIMTAAIVLESCKDIENESIAADDSLYTEFREYEYPNDIRYANIYEGDELTVSDYLYAMMMTSSCEAAVILADHFGGGSISKFVDMMNEKAKEIGCKDTVFKNPHGLYDPEQLTTARDVALMTQYALSLPHFEEIATCEDHVIEPVSANSEHTEEWSISHSNVMMSPASEFYLYGIKGIKTGNLDKAGRSVVTLGIKDELSYILVALNSPLENADGELRYYHMADGLAIMDWVFKNFSNKVVLSKKEEKGEIKVADSDDDGYVLVKPARDVSTLWYSGVDTTSIQENTRLAEDVKAPVKKGEKLGEIELKLGDEVIDTVDLIAANDVDRSLLKSNVTIVKEYFFSNWFKLALVIAAAVSLIYAGLCIWAYRDYKVRAKGSFSNKKIVKKLYGNNRRR